MPVRGRVAGPNAWLGWVVLGGLLPALAELLPLPVNDNLAIPVLSALFLMAGEKAGILSRVRA